MTKEEFKAKRDQGRRKGKSKIVWLMAMVFFGCCLGVLYLIGFLCYLPFEHFLPEDRMHVLIREVLLLVLVISIAGGILVADWVWRKRNGFVCPSCKKRLDSRVEETGYCGHCGLRIFSP
jgi:hypothetical protein